MRPTKTGIITASATAIGIAAVIACSPTPQGTSVATTAATGSTTGGASSSTTAATEATSETTTETTADASPASATYLGDAYDTPYGPMQVQATVLDGVITDITWVQLPSDGHSQRINDSAAPTLVTEALEAQSADVASVSGATYTSDGFKSSLQSALTQAGL